MYGFQKEPPKQCSQRLLSLASIPGTPSAHKPPIALLLDCAPPESPEPLETSKGHPGNCPGSLRAPQLSEQSVPGQLTVSVVGFGDPPESPGVCLGGVTCSEFGSAASADGLSIHIYIYIYMAVSHFLLQRKSAPQRICTPTFVFTRLELMHVCGRPTERSEACSDRSDEGRDCKRHVTQTTNCTEQTHNCI